MKTKKLIALLLAAVCACSLLAACGNRNTPSAPSDETTSAGNSLNVATIGEAMALADKGEEQSSVGEKAYIYAFELNGVYWRLTADLTAEQHDALWALDITDADYEEKEKELLSPLAVTKCENLNAMLPSDDEINALASKTGEDLLNDGWTIGTGYNLEEMDVYMDKGLFSYTVTFESDEQFENTDDFDIEAAIRPLKVKAVRLFGLAQSVTDEPGSEAGTAEDLDASGVDYLVLVNKQNKLPEGWEDTIELEDAQNDIPEGVELNEDNNYLAADVFKVEKKTLEAFRALQEDLAAEGIIILLDSTYRSVARQEELWSEFEAEYGLEYTQNTVAVPGTSEHHTGLAVDVCIVKDGAVVNENADMIAEREIFAKIHEKLADYGFILRFPENGKEITGYDYEPWHFRYVGVDAAKAIAEEGVTLEEYLGALPADAE